MAFDAGTLASATTGTFVGNVFSDTFTILSNEVDMVRLRLTAGQTYQFDIDNGTSGDLYIRIFDIFGTEVRANDDGFRADDDVVFSNSPWFHFIPNHTGDYFVAVSPYYLNGYDPVTVANRNTPENPISTTSGTLFVTVAETDLWPTEEDITGFLTEGTFDDTDVLREEDGSLRVRYSGRVNNAGDVDIGRFDLVKGDVLVFDVNGLEANGTVLRIFNSAGTQLGIDDDSGTGDDPELTFVLPSALSVFVGISGDGNNAYDAVTGSGTIAGAIGDFEVIIHKNPTQVGSSAANSFVGSDGNNYLVCLAGNDTAFGNLGEDTIAGGDDNDSLNGGDGRDYLYGEHGADTMDGGPGSDVVAGGIGDDRITGGTTSANDSLEGNEGADTLLDGNGNDSLYGGTGNDSQGAGAGNNSLDGGDGNDTLIAGDGNDTALGGLGNDSLNASDGLNLLDGGDGADTIRGGANADFVVGGAGNDSISGLDGNDTMVGGGDADTLLGGLGNDTLSGDIGNDQLSGNGGTDIFDFNAVAEQTDLITDLVLGTDRIDLTGIFGAGVVNGANLAQFVQTSTAGITDSFLAVDANGLTGGLSFTIIAQVSGVTAVQLFDVNIFVL